MPPTVNDLFSGLPLVCAAFTTVFYGASPGDIYGACKILGIDSGGVGIRTHRLGTDTYRLGIGTVLEGKRGLVGSRRTPDKAVTGR